MCFLCLSLLSLNGWISFYVEFLKWQILVRFMPFSRNEEISFEDLDLQKVFFSGILCDLQNFDHDFFSQKWFKIKKSLEVE